MSSPSTREPSTWCLLSCVSTLLSVLLSLSGCSLLLSGDELMAGCKEGTRACGTECVPSGDDRYEHDGKCVAAQICKPGERIWKDRTATTDRECRECPEGQFSSGENATACAEPRVCPPGQYETAPPSANRDADRECASCRAGTFSTKTNAEGCVAFGGCAPGQVQANAGTPHSDIVCEPCAEDEYAEDDECKPVTKCVTGEFLERVATPVMDAVCLVVDDCEPGSYVEAEATSTENRECKACPPKSFNPSENATKCEPWSQCLDNEWESEAPDATRNRSCSEVHDCLVGQIVTAEPTSTSDRSCSWCTQGTGANTVTARECRPWTLLRVCQIEASTQSLLCFGQEPLFPPAEDDATDAGANRKWSAVDGNGSVTCATPSDRGKPVCWGNREAGSFEAVGEGLSFSSLSVGSNHACGVLDSGEVYCWGSNSTGQSTPPAGKFRSVSAGLYHSCGVLADTGHVRCWGSPPPAEDYGQVSKTEENVAFSSVSAGHFHTCGVVEETGTAKCWGIDNGDPESGYYRDHGQVNDTPTDVVFSAIASGSLHNCGLRKADAEIQCWGIDDQSNSFEDDGQVRHTPRGVRFVSVSARSQYSCGVREDGALQCWGDTIWP